ncbi:MAG: iron-containing alcohol dehydrogenase [Deltaproteobacteria bacterium]|nr:iron-containing alcohol dehydrogenase [Deltaproteobacteria bacterium]
MQNFVLHNPTTIIFGTDTVHQIGRETAPFGKKVLLVYGQGSIKNNNIHAQVTSALQQAGLDVVEHGGVRSNPLLSHVQAGIAKARLNRVEAIVAVGGGSVIDSAKAIAAGIPVDHNVWQFFRGKKSIRSALPLTCVLTLAASGSEMNGGMVITNELTRQKFGTGNRLLNPKVSILDPSLTFTVPADYTAYGAVDAIAHILEFYFTTRDRSTPVQDRFMEGLVINIMESCDKVLGNPYDYQGRADLMWAATLALNGWTAAGLGMVGFPMHMIEHSLSALYNIAHGAGLSIVIPSWMRYQARLNPEKFMQFAHRVFGLSGDSENCAMEGIAYLQRWFTSVKSPVSLAAAGIQAEDIPLIAENALPLAKLWRLKDYTKEIIMEILSGCR